MTGLRCPQRRSEPLESRQINTEIDSPSPHMHGSLRNQRFALHVSPFFVTFTSIPLAGSIHLTTPGRSRSGADAARRNAPRGVVGVQGSEANGVTCAGD